MIRASKKSAGPGVQIPRDLDKIFDNEKVITEWEKFFLNACDEKGVMGKST